MASDLDKGGTAKMLVPRDKAFCSRGRELYAEKNFAAALKSFQLATWLCGCNKETAKSYKKLGMDLEALPTPTCHCKTFSANDVLENKADFYTIAKKPCVCGSGIKHCTSAVHIQALDHCAAASEALGYFKAAYSYSLLLLIIAPEHPEGYMRMGKAKRLMASGSPMPIDCAVIYKQGLRNVQKYGDKTHAKLKILARLCKTACKGDFVQLFPSEVTVMIFRQLPMRDLCRFMRVSKSWRRATLTRDLWKHLDFGEQRKAVSSKVLAKIINKWAEGKTKSIIIGEPQRFKLDCQKLFMMVYGLSDLQTLVVRRRIEPYTLEASSLPEAPQPSKPPKLTKLVVSYFVTSYGPLKPIFPYASPTLKELRLSQAPMLIGQILPVMPSLETLELVVTAPSHRPAKADSWTDFRYSHTWIVDLIDKTPNLRRLSLCGTGEDSDRSMFPSSGAADEKHWEKLEEFAVGNVTRLHGLFFPHLPTTLRVLDVSNLWFVRDQLIDLGDEGGLAPLKRFENLEYFRCSDGVGFSKIHTLRDFLRPSVENHKLRGLEVNYLEHVVDVCTPLSALDFLCKEDIVDLGLTNFRFPDLNFRGGKYESSLEWLQTFPNLQTVAVYPFDGIDCHYVVEGLVLIGIKTIYQDCLMGVERDRIMALAKEKGVTIIHRPSSSWTPRYYKPFEEM